MPMQGNLVTSTALTTAVVFITGAALGADLQKPDDPSPAAKPYSWSGCYGGANAGLGSGHVRETVDIPAIAIIDTSGTASAFTGGGQIGCNLQHDKSVFGIESDIDYRPGSKTVPLDSVLSGDKTVGSQKTSSIWLGTVRGRLGYAWDRALVYATAGFATGDVRSSFFALAIDPATDNFVATYSGSHSSTGAGWAAGGGYECAITTTISAKVEYLHLELGNSNYSVSRVSGGGPLGASWATSGRFSGNLVRVGLNVKFVEF